MYRYIYISVYVYTDMYIYISIYRDVYYIYVPGHARARAHTRLYTGAGPDDLSLLRRRCTGDAVRRLSFAVEISMDTYIDIEIFRDISRYISMW
jgi:hypothetical protein